MTTRVLFQTIVGSQCWNMAHEGSDRDLFTCFIWPTKDFLAGRTPAKDSYFNHGHDQDEARHEIGVVIGQLLKGNYNFLVGVLSPLVEVRSYEHDRLSSIVRSHPAKNFYHAIRGMAYHNASKYVETLAIEPKRVNAILRILEFGRIYLRTGEALFSPYEGKLEEYPTKLRDLEDAYNTSRLPETLPEKKLRDLLLDVRITELERDAVE